MSVLKLFPNLAVYKLVTVVEYGSMVDLPGELSDITVFTWDRSLLQQRQQQQNNLMPIRMHDFQVISRGVDVPGTQVVINNNQQGTLIAIGNDYVDILHSSPDGRKSAIQRIYKPKSITTENNNDSGSGGNDNSNQKKGSLLAGVGKSLQWTGRGGTIVITGVIIDLSWDPLYTIVLSEYANRIANLVLSGTIKVPPRFSPFAVDRIEFNTKPLIYAPNNIYYGARSVSSGGGGGGGVSATSMMSQANTTSHTTGYVPNNILGPSISYGDSDEGDGIDVIQNLNQVYSWVRRDDEPIIVQGELSDPLIETNNINVDRVYFLSLYDNDNQISFGYMYENNQPLPNGTLQSFDSRLNVIGRSQFTSFGRRVILKVGYEMRLNAQVIVSTINRKISTPTHRFLGSSTVPVQPESQSSQQQQEQQQQQQQLTNTLSSMRAAPTTSEGIDYLYGINNEGNDNNTSGGVDISMDVMTVNYDVHVYSSMQYPIVLFLEYPAHHQRIYNPQPSISYQTPETVYWKRVIVPGANHFQGMFSIPM